MKFTEFEKETRITNFAKRCHLKHYFLIKRGG